MLLIKGLEKKFGDFSLSLDLSVGAGETLALVGPSGSGKTSALNLIAGLARPEAGEVFIDGKNITGLPPWKRNIAVVFQDLALFPHLDVGGNIAYGLSLRKVPREERVRVVKETLDLVRLPGYGKRRIHTLSGGERQRVAIARALASSPNALLLDEPFSSLDAPLRKSLRRDFLEIRSRSPVPCVFVTHDQEEALALGDKIALMEGGRIVESGPGRDLLLAPRTENAARFFGAGHVLPCRVTGKSETGAEVSSPLGNLNVTASGINPPSSVLFIPRDALIYGEPDEKGKWKPAGAVFSLSLYEGLGLTMKLLLSSRENGFTPDEAASGTNENFSLEINTGPRIKAPPAGSPVKLWVNEDLVRFVKPDKSGHY